MSDGASVIPRRRDSLRTRGRLLDAAGTLLRDRGTAFTLPDLARESGVSTATTYRHFDDVHAVFDAYYGRTIGDLLEALASAIEPDDPRRSFEAICRHWVDHAVDWGRAVTHIRNATGYLERVRAAEDPLLIRLYAILGEVVAGLVSSTALPPVDLDYAQLVWITLFDERVVVDLSETLRWSPDRIARHLGDSVMAAWTAAG